DTFVLLCPIFLFFFNDPATTEIYTLSLHERSSDLLGKIEAVGRPLLPPMPMVAGVFLPGAAIGPCETLLDQSRIADPPAEKGFRSEEHTSELQSRSDLVCRLLLEKKNRHVENSNK